MPRSRLAASALPGGAALWDIAHSFRAELARLHTAGRELRARWRRMASPTSHTPRLHVRILCSRALADAYELLLNHVLHLFFGRLPSPAPPREDGGAAATRRTRTTYGLAVSWDLQVDEAIMESPILAYEVMLRGTRLDHAGPEKLRAFLLSGQVDWAVHFGMDLARRESVQDCWPSWFGEEHRWIHLRDLRWHMLGGQLAEALHPGGRRTRRRPAIDGAWAPERRIDIREVGDLPSLAFLESPDGGEGRAPPGWRRSPRTMRDWVELLREATAHPWRVPGTLGETIPATRMSALLTFQAGASLLHAATETPGDGPACDRWILRHAQNALLLAFRALIEQGDLPGMISIGLWLARVYAELGHAQDPAIPPGLGGPGEGATPGQWLDLARARVENAANLLLQLGRPDEEARVRDAWGRLAASVEAGSTVLVRRYARELVGQPASAGAGTVDAGPRLLLLGGARLPQGSTIVEVLPPGARPEHDPYPWTARHAHAVVVAGDAPLTAEEMERWFPNGDAPVLAAPPSCRAELPDRPTVEAARRRRSPPPLRLDRGAPWPRDGRPPQVFVNFPADPAYGRFARLLRDIASSADLALTTDYDEPVTEPERRKRIVHKVNDAFASIHDLSRYSGQGPMALARMNMPFELGLAMGRFPPDQRILILVDAGEPIESYLSDIPACRGFLVRGYRGSSSFERAIRDALWVWGCPTAWSSWCGTVRP